MIYVYLVKLMITCTWINSLWEKRIPWIFWKNGFNKGVTESTIDKECLTSWRISTTIILFIDNQWCFFFCLTVQLFLRFLLLFRHGRSKDNELWGSFHFNYFDLFKNTILIHGLLIVIIVICYIIIPIYSLTSLWAIIQ